MGFSAATGELSDNFDLISVETSNLYVTTPPAAASSSHEPEKPQNRKERLKAEKAARKAAQEAAGKAAKKAEKEISGWGWFTKLFIFVLVVGGCYGGFTVYRSSSKKYSRFD